MCKTKQIHKGGWALESCSGYDSKPPLPNSVGTKSDASGWVWGFFKLQKLGWMARRGEARDVAEMTRGPIKWDRKDTVAYDLEAGSYRQLPAVTGSYRQLPAVTGSYRQLPTEVATPLAEFVQAFRGSRHNSLLAAASK